MIVNFPSQMKSCPLCGTVVMSNRFDSVSVVIKCNRKQTTILTFQNITFSSVCFLANKLHFLPLQFDP